VKEVKEVNIGGITPSEDGDWREWASTAKERPMPVVYDLEPLWNLMNEEMSDAFQDAIKYIYDPKNENDGESESDLFQNAINFGVASPNGEPISSYSISRVSGLTSQAILRRPSDENPFYMYDIKWRGSDRAVSAVFANTIRDNIAPNIREDEYELGFFDNRFSDQVSLKNSLKTFGLSQERGAASIGVFEEFGIASENMLNSFTYLTADNVEEIDEYIVGVVHPQGYILNKKFGKSPGFRIEMNNDRDFRVIFDSDKFNFTSPPTFIVSPMWFAADGVLPSNAAEIQIGLTNCTISECEVQVGGIQLASNRTTYSTTKSEWFVEAAEAFYDAVTDVIDIAGDVLSTFNPIAGLITDGIVDIRNGAKMIRTIIPGMNENFFLPNYFLPFTLAAKAYTGYNPFTIKSDTGFNTEGVDLFTDQFLGFSFMAIDPTFDISRLSNDSDSSNSNCTRTSKSNDCNGSSASTSTSNLKMIHGIINIDVETTEISILPNINISIATKTIIKSYTGSGFKAAERFRKAPPFDMLITKDASGGKIKNVNIQNQTVGGVRIDFDEPFIGIPTVFASPITGTFQFGRAEVTDVQVTRTIKTFLGIQTGYSEEIKKKNAELVGYPSVLVEHISERSTFIKAGIIHTLDTKVMLNGGDTPSIYEPVSFHFVAIGPISPRVL